MLKRDSLTAQMQQLSQVLAKVKRLIIEDNESEAFRITSKTILEYYSISEGELLNETAGEFMKRLKNRAFKAEEVNMLAYFIDEYAGLQDEFANQVIVYRKLIKIFDYLDRDLQYLSFDHIARRNLLEQQLKK